MVMNRRNTKVRACKFWNCQKRVRIGHTYCYDHYQAFQNGELDECPVCGRAKSSIYSTCLDCRSEETEKPARSSRTRREHSDSQEARDAEEGDFYVYVLKLDHGGFYAGQTREISERLMEHRNGITRSTAHRNPKLVWFKTVSTRGHATRLEAELKKLCDRNPREIRRWVRSFQDLVEELDFS